jgi:ParB family chromosome partitioning protein
MDLNRIIPDPNQPRKDFGQEAIDRLAASFRKYGQLQPIRVRWEAGLAKRIVISGERRYRAAIEAGLEQVACIFVEGELTPSEILQEQMIENCLWEDLKPIEQAKAYRQLMDLHGWTAKQLADELHISQATISRSLALLALPDDLQGQVDAGSVPASAAYEIAKVKDDAVRQDIVDQVVAGSMTRDEVADAVRESTGRSARAGRGEGDQQAVGDSEARTKIVDQGYQDRREREDHRNVQQEDRRNGRCSGRFEGRRQSGRSRAGRHGESGDCGLTPGYFHGETDRRANPLEHIFAAIWAVP